MISSEVQRTLVKSPPELWAELSDPVVLARHLGELGEIRIVRTEPERTVEWEAAAADGAEVSGKVQIESSGWGTKVTLSASHETPTPEPLTTVPEAEAKAVQTELEPTTVPETEAVQIEPTTVHEALPEAEPPAALEALSGREPELVEPEPEPALVEPESRPGFFARLFRRRRDRPEPEQSEPEPEPVVELEADGAVVIEEEASETALEMNIEPDIEPVPGTKIEPAPEMAEPAPEMDISVELAALEEQTEAVLTGVLDRLGAAHHRPFSRA